MKCLFIPIYVTEIKRGFHFEMTMIYKTYSLSVYVELDLYEYDELSRFTSTYTLMIE